MAKPQTADGYARNDVELVRSACLSLATYLGSFLDDLVVVGGLVPTLIVSPKGDSHIGTQDLDLGLSLALLENARYAELVAQLQSAGYEPDKNSAGKPANHRWIHREEKVTVDFLIEPTPQHANEKIRTIESSLSAVQATGIPLAFRDRLQVSISGQTLRGEKAERKLWVCGAGAFIIMKALAAKGRGENKDAYDLYYVLRNFGADYVTAVADAIRPLLDAPAAQEAVAFLRTDFSEADHTGPHRAALFLARRDLSYRTDLAAAVRLLLEKLEQ